MGKLAKLGYGNAKGARSQPKATDLWRKTTKNSPIQEIDPKQNWGYFLGFSKFLSKKNLGDLWDESVET